MILFLKSRHFLLTFSFVGRTWWEDYAVSHVLIFFMRGRLSFRDMLILSLREGFDFLLWMLLRLLQWVILIPLSRVLGLSLLKGLPTLIVLFLVLRLLRMDWQHVYPSTSISSMEVGVVWVLKLFFIASFNQSCFYCIWSAKRYCFGYDNKEAHGFFNTIFMGILMANDWYIVSTKVDNIKKICRGLW